MFAYYVVIVFGTQAEFRRTTKSYSIIQFQKRIDTDVIDEVKGKIKKIKKIKIPRRSSLRPVLICEGEISYKTEQKLTEFFYKIIKFQDLLIQP